MCLVPDTGWAVVRCWHQLLVFNLFHQTARPMPGRVEQGGGGRAVGTAEAYEAKEH